MSDGPWGDAWGVAYAALFLASDEVKYITRVAPVVDQRNAGRGVITQCNRGPGSDFIAVSHRKKRRFYAEVVGWRHLSTVPNEHMVAFTPTTISYSPGAALCRGGMRRPSSLPLVRREMQTFSHSLPTRPT